MTQEALRMALEALKAAQELAGKHDAELEYGFQQAIAALAEALAQQEQESVAWVLEWTFDGEEKGRRLYDDERQCKFDAENDGGVCRSLVYSNTAPPQRTWVGLNKEDIESWELPNTPTVAEFAWFVEAKLKEKNT